MPEMRKEGNPSSISLGNVTLQTTPATADQFIPMSGQLDGGVAGDTLTITSGAYRVVVHNTGLENITVNGDVITPDDTQSFECKFNPATNRLDLTPELTISVPPNGKGFYTGERPST